MNCFVRMTWAAATMLATGLLLPAQAEKVTTPLKALLIVGGCCHDYDNQKTIIPEGVSARSSVPIEWTVIHQGGKTVDTMIPFYQKENWAEGYDVVVHNECFAAVGDEAFIEKILAPHRAGTPAVLVHCAMHCYRTGPTKEEWFKFCGVHSPKHGPHHAFEVELMETDHDVTRGLSNWTTPKGELYYIEKVYPGTTALAQGKSNADDRMHINIWTHAYGENKTRVFGTTIGHHNETMQDPNYLQMFTRGLLWAAGKNVDETFVSQP